MEQNQGAFDSFKKWIQVLFSGDRQPAARSNRPTKNVLIAAPDEPAENAVRLGRKTEGFLVRCSSCGVLHELDAVCYRCGEPLCNDTQNCRNTARYHNLEILVTVCAGCKDEVD